MPCFYSDFLPCCSIFTYVFYIKLKESRHPVLLIQLFQIDFRLKSNGMIRRIS